MRAAYIIAHLRLALLELQDSQTVTKEPRGAAVDTLRRLMKDVENLVEN